MVVRKLGGSNFELYSKGAPEMIASLCEPSSGEITDELCGSVRANCFLFCIYICVFCMYTLYR